MTIRERIHRWHSPSLFTLIALCFLLPFATVTFVASCGPQHGKTSFTGIQLATHTVPRGTGTCGGSTAMNTCVEQASSTSAEIAFGACIVGLVLGLLGVAVGPGWCAAVGLGALLQIFFDLGLGVGDTRFHTGYSLALLLFAWVGVLHLRRWWARRPVGVEHGPGYWAGVIVGALVLSVYSLTAGGLWLAPLLFASCAAGLNLVRAVKRGRAQRALDRAVSEPESAPG